MELFNWCSGSVGRTVRAVWPARVAGTAKRRVFRKNTIQKVLLLNMELLALRPRCRHHTYLLCRSMLNQGRAVGSTLSHRYRKNGVHVILSAGDPELDSLVFQVRLGTLPLQIGQGRQRSGLLT